MRRICLIVMVVLLAACRRQEAPSKSTARGANLPPSNLPASEAPKSPAAPDSRRLIACFGDSITAGLGLDADQSFPNLLQQDLDRHHYRYRVVNLGASGETTQDGIARMPMVLAEKPAIVLVELGANDGLRGLPLSITERNLGVMITAFQAAGARVVLAGMTLPPNYGTAYIHRFESIYRSLAAEHKVTLIPFLLAGVGGNPQLMQRDGLHPNAAGARRVEANVWHTIEPLLK